MEKNLSPRDVVHKANNVAQDVLLTAEVREEKVLETARKEAEDLRIRNSLKPQWMLDHEESDRREFASIRLAIGGLATKSDTEEILKAIKTVHVGFGFVKIGWRTFLTIGGIAGAFMALLTFGKVFIVWLASLVVGR